MSEKEIIQDLLSDLAKLRQSIGELDDKINDRLNTLPYEAGRQYQPASNRIYTAYSILKEAGESLEYQLAQHGA